jgi:hypothetical protein
MRPTPKNAFNAYTAAGTTLALTVFDICNQIMHAQEQHHELLQAIRKYSRKDEYDIELIVIPLGGTVYKSAKKSLHQHLGVTGPALDTLMRRLHMHAVHTLTRIIRYRRIKMGTRTGKQWYPCSTSSAASSSIHNNSGMGQKVVRKRQGTKLPHYKHKKRKKKRWLTHLYGILLGLSGLAIWGDGGMLEVGSSSSSGGVLLPASLGLVLCWGHMY